MNRMHIHVGVENLAQSIRFYTALFGTEPAKTKNDYAKWMLDDPRLNFAISTRLNKNGVDHLGVQVDDKTELDALRARLESADLSVFDEGESTCCYARSDKSWVKDPSGVAWEAFRTMSDAQLFGQEAVEPEPGQTPNACCG
ncbi:MAG: ArsI/CadI family heavy metal resistance metalloenzyme [Gammaproteobacteria bacterium]